VALGVGNNPYSIPPVPCTKRRRRNDLPFCIVPARGHVSENFGKGCPFVDSKEAWNVLQQNVSWSYQANDSSDFGPEPSVVLDSAHVSGIADRLARESGCDDVNPADIDPK